MPVLSALWRVRKKGHRFETSLEYTESSCFKFFFLIQQDYLHYKCSRRILSFLWKESMVKIVFSTKKKVKSLAKDTEEMLRG